MKYAAQSNIGNIRKNNEDAVYIPKAGEPPIAIVADGMGGHNAGEVASRVAVSAIVSHIATAGEVDETAMRKAMREANDSVLRHSYSERAHLGMGTTLTCVYLRPSGFIVAHAGDSSAYLLSAGKIIKLTRDHTYVQGLLDAKVISVKQARVHPRRNIITNCVGATTDFTPDVFSRDWTTGDVLLLCSDGLSDYLEEKDIAKPVLKGGGIADAACLLVGRALELGGADNISVVLVENDGEA